MDIATDTLYTVALRDFPDLPAKERIAAEVRYCQALERRLGSGTAVADLLREPAFAGRVPVYAGDDVTDEFALAFVRQAGGISIKVGPAPTVAEFRLDDIAALHRWLGVAAA